LKEDYKGELNKSQDLPPGSLNKSHKSQKSNQDLKSHADLKSQHKSDLQQFRNSVQSKQDALNKSQKSLEGLRRDESPGLQGSPMNASKGVTDK